MDYSLINVYEKDKFILRSNTQNRQFPFIKYSGDNYDELVSIITSASPNTIIPPPQKLKLGGLYTYSGKDYRLKCIPIIDVRCIIASYPYLVLDDGECIQLAMDYLQAEAYLKENRHHKVFAYENILATYKYNPEHSSFIMYDRSHPNGFPINGLFSSYEWFICGDDGANRITSNLKPIYTKVLHSVDFRPDFGDVVYRIGRLMHRINQELSIQGRPILFSETWESQDRRKTLKKTCHHNEHFKSFIEALYLIIFEETKGESPLNTSALGEIANEPFIQTVSTLYNYYEHGRDSKERPISVIFQKYLEHNLGPDSPDEYIQLQDGLLADFYSFVQSIIRSIKERITIVGIIRLDENGNLYCGKAILPHSYDVYLGCQCEIVTLSKNMDENAIKYPYYSDVINSVSLKRTATIKKDEEGTVYIDKFIVKDSSDDRLGKKADIELIRPFVKPKGNYLGEVLEYTLLDEKVDQVSEDIRWDEVIERRWKKKRSLDDFIFVKEANLSELYERICQSLANYENDKPELFCETSRRPLERALKEVYYIIEKKPIPEYVGDRIGNLRIMLPEELYPFSVHEALSQYNKLVRQYNHDDSFPPPERWNRDAEECYRLMYLCFKWVASFRHVHDEYFEEHEPIDYEQKLIERFVAKSDLPQFNSVENCQMPDYEAECLTTLGVVERYKESLKLDLTAIYQDVFEKSLHTFENTAGILEGITLLDKEAIESLSHLSSLREFIPKVIATRHVCSYFSTIHPILLRESWDPSEVANKEYSGANLKLEQLYQGLHAINLYASKIVIGKLSVDELARNNLCRILDDGSRKAASSFYKAVNELPEGDKQILNNIGNFRRFIIIRDRGLLFNAKNKALEIFSSRKSANFDIKACVIDFCNNIDEIISSILIELYDAKISSNWDNLFEFEHNYITNILEAKEAQPYLDVLRKQGHIRTEEKVIALPSRPDISKNKGITISNAPFTNNQREYHYSLPEDLFDGKVDYMHEYIPGLKNCLKTLDVFGPIFNYILRIGKVTQDEEAGALLRVFTGYPVEKASTRAKWESDYHILFYIVKYMFTSKTLYVKMRECIDITYPSDEERQKAERSPSSYAERISGNDAPYIIETLSRLSSVFPRPETPITD